MRKLYLRMLAVACSLGASSGLGSQAWAQARAAAPYFRDEAAAARSPLSASLRQSRALTLDAPALQAALATAPAETQRGAVPLVLALPLPDGSTARFAVVETAVMAPELAARYPMIKTYRGTGLDDPEATVRLDMTPRGFHAQILSRATGTVYVDPATLNDPRHYLSFYRRDMNPTAVGAAPVCQFQPTVAELTASRIRTAAAGTAQRTTISAGAALRTYRLAVATTGEYTAFHGGTVALGLSAVVTSINRVVGVYEKELAVRLVLVANNNLLVYTNANTDPYTNNNSSTLLAENQANIDAVIGASNYDIGHVFSTAGGGLAGLGVVCRAGNKARGETGTSSPVGDAYDIDYVAHEIGHQFGGNHTFNSSTSSCSGNGNSSTAFEPGSGSTIMAYAGICGATDNLQRNSDAYFHSGSFQEMQAFINTATCAATTTTGNTAPVVAAPGTKTLPIGTPFRLTASATDAENDALTYCWEQMDTGPFGSVTAPQVTGQTPPLFRSFSPTASPTRYFPRLSDVINNASSTAERLPTVTRTLKFRCTARDQHSGPAGVIGGVNYSADVNLSVTSNAGPFVVTAPNAALTWPGNSTQTVTWDVAGTNSNGVNCTSVNILLSTDGGLTYPTTLVSGAANNGSATITVPSVATTTARIMVAAADNYFYDISNANFTITAPTPCNAATNVAVGSVTQTTAAVSFAASATATSYVVSTTPASTTQTVTGTTASLTGLTAGTSYTVNVVSNCSAGATSTAATASFTTVAPPPCNAPTNLVASSITATSATISFTASGTATSYTVSTFPATTTQTVTTQAVTLSGLTAATNYTVSIVSNCGGGNTSVPATLTFGTSTPNDACTAAVQLTSAVSCSPTSGTVTGATQSQAPSSCNGATSTSAFDVWYKFTATGPTHTVTTNSAFDGVVQAFSGTCGSLSSLGCRDFTASGTETLALSGLTAGTTYYVRYYPYDTMPTDGSFTICVTGPVAPTCNAATNVAVGSVTQTTAAVSFAASATATSYVVSTTPASTTQTVTGTTASLTGLTAGTNYTVNVVSNCSAGATSTAATASFTTVSTPTLTALNPTSAAVGTSITITGTNLTGASAVSFNGTAATTFSVNSATSITATVPAGATSGNVTVTTPSGPTNGLPFTIALPDLLVSTTATIPAGAYNNITVTGTGNATLGGATSVAGSFTVQSGGTFDDGCQVLTGAGSFSLTAGATLATCHAQGISATGNTGSIQVTGSRSFSPDASYMFDGTAPQSIGAGVPATVLNFTSTNAAAVTVTQDLAVRRLLTLNAGDLLLGNANLTLTSGPTGTAMVVNNGAGRVLNTGSGQAVVQRYINASSGYAGAGYRHYSSPVSSTTVADLATSGFAPQVNAAYNALPTPTLNAAQFPTVFGYNETRLTASFPSFDTGWNSPSSTADALTPTRGYTVNLAPTALVDLRGALNTGAIGTGQLTRGATAESGWQLLGNPYPAPLDWARVTGTSGALPAGLADAIYVYEPTSQYAGIYRSFVNGIGTGGFNGVLPAMQGFFIRATQPVAAGFTFQNAYRVTSYQDPAFLRGTTTDARPQVRLQLRATAGGPADEAVVYLEAGATTGTDARYDAVKLPNAGLGLGLTTQMPGAEALAISGLPLMAATSPALRVPLTLDVAAAGSYRLSAATLSGFAADQPVQLYDAELNAYVDLQQQAAYPFALSRAGRSTGRFFLVLGRPGSVTATAAGTALQLTVWPNPAQEQAQLNVTLSQAVTNGRVTLRDVVGRAVGTRSFSGPSTSLPTAGLATGTYLLVVEAPGLAPVTRRLVVE